MTIEGGVSGFVSGPVHMCKGCMYEKDQPLSDPRFSPRKKRNLEFSI